MKRIATALVLIPLVVWLVLKAPWWAFATVLALVAAGQGVALVPQLGAIGGPADVVLTPLRTRRRTRIAYRRGTRHHPAVSACVAAIRGSAAAHPG